MSPVMAGTGLLADDLYLMAHHETTGRPYLQPRPLGIGMAAGLLAELILVETITITRQADVALTSRAASADSLARDVLTLIRSEHQPRPVQDWLLFMARTATEDVACRLERAGYLARTNRRTSWRAPRWVPTDAHSAFAPLLRACSVLDATRLPTVQYAVLAGLAAAAGLGYRIDEHATSRATRHVEDVVAFLHPIYGELIRQTQAAVDSAVLSQRA